MGAWTSAQRSDTCSSPQSCGDSASEAARKLAAVQDLLGPIIAGVPPGQVGFPVVAREGDDCNATYNALRTRPFAYSDHGYPLVIFLPATTAEVAALVRELRAVAERLHEHGVHVAVACGCRTCSFRRSTAKGKADVRLRLNADGQLSMASDCVTIDLQRINYARLDARCNTIAVGGGAKLKHVFEALRGHNLGVATGTHGDTGVGGLTLSGGVGYLCARLGMACDTMTEATVVLASGAVVVATDRNEHAALMRALRGGGGNFGVVTEFVFECADVSQCSGGAQLCFAPTQGMLQAALRSWDNAVQTCMRPHQFSIFVLPIGAPGYGVVGSSVSGKHDASADGEFLARLSRVEGALVKIGAFRPMDFCTELQPIVDRFVPRMNMCDTGLCLDSLSDRLIGVIVERSRGPARLFFRQTGIFMLMPVAYAAARGLAGRPSCVRRGKYWLFCETTWLSESDKAAALEWHRETVRQVRALPQCVGTTAHTWQVRGDEASTYDDARAGAAPAAAAAREFVRRAKHRYDPTNFWRMNVNVEPAAAEPDSEDV